MMVTPFDPGTHIDMYEFIMGKFPLGVRLSEQGILFDYRIICFAPFTCYIILKKNLKTCSHFLSFLDTDMAHGVEVCPCGRQWPFISHSQ